MQLHAEKHLNILRHGIRKYDMWSHVRYLVYNAIHTALHSHGITHAVTATDSIKAVKLCSWIMGYRQWQKVIQAVQYVPGFWKLP